MAFLNIIFSHLRKSLRIIRDLATRQPADILPQIGLNYNCTHFQVSIVEYWTHNEHGEQRGNNRESTTSHLVARDGLFRSLHASQTTLPE